MSLPCADVGEVVGDHVDDDLWASPRGDLCSCDWRGDGDAVWCCSVSYAGPPRLAYAHNARSRQRYWWSGDKCVGYAAL